MSRCTTFVTSPYGVGIQNGTNTMTFELKCPFPDKFHCRLFYKVPGYYIPHIWSQMNLTLNGSGEPVSQSIFLCWTDESNTPFRVENDLELWQYMYGGLLSIWY